MTKSDNKEEGGDPLAFANSMRGKYIISQALYYAIKELEKVEDPLREVSNIADMTFLHEHVFPMFDIGLEMGEKIKAVARLRQATD